MASLLEKIFQTMPLAAVLDAIRPTGQPLGDIAGMVQCATDAVNFSFDPKKPTPEEEAEANEGDSLPIWGWTMDSNLAAVTNITCRVRGDEFKQYVVLNRIDFGCVPADPTVGFARTVRVQRWGREFELPLAERFRLITIATSGAWLRSYSSALFPLESRQDPSFVVVYAYDILPITGELVSLRDDDHPEKAAIDGLLGTCIGLNTLSPSDTQNAFDYLFNDDLWHAAPLAGPGVDLGDALAASLGFPGVAAVVGEAVQSVGVRPTRVLVALSFTVCKERDDYVPGHLRGHIGAVGMGRMYPHTMVVATDHLERVHTAVRFSRPRETTIVGGHVCGCGEMLSEIGTGLWTDANEGNEMAVTGGVNPMPFWSNIFNYFIADPDVHPATAGRRIAMVRRQLGSRDVTNTSFVERDCESSDGMLTDVQPENAGRITKVARQAEFDNIHLAPRMRVRAKIDHATTGSKRAAFTTLEEWKMDRIVMAPFCAHDCFHMHTRWSGGLGYETPVMGWNAVSPYAQPEAPMVPINHDVDIQLLGPNAFLFIDEAVDAPADVWQVACYPGCGYALTMRTAASSADGATAFFANQWFVGADKQDVGGTAMFYWRLRHYFVIREDGSFEVRERVEVKDPAAALSL